MDFQIDCAVCGLRMGADGVDPVQAEHLADVFTRRHAPHSPAELRDFARANAGWFEDDDEGGGG